MKKNVPDVQSLMARCVVKILIGLICVAFPLTGETQVIATFLKNTKELSKEGTDSLAQEQTNKLASYGGSVSAPSAALREAAAPSLKVIGYLPNWIDPIAFFKNFDLAKVTHINIAFENTDSNGDLSISPNNATIIQKAHAAGVKVFVSVGGGTASETSSMRDIYFNLISDAHRAGFVSKLTSYLQTNNLDGIDIDLEGAAINADYGKFIADLSKALKPISKGLSAALSVGNGGSNVPSSAFSDLDWINIMAYDSTGPWSPGNPGQHASYSFAVSNVNYWINKGLPKSKAMLGLPFYGYGFNSNQGSYKYSEIVATYPGAENVDQVANTIWYNGIPTIKSKTKYAIDQQLGGVMIWELSQDAIGARSLLLAIDQVIKGGNATANLPPLINLTLPSNNAVYAAPAAIELMASASDGDGSISKVDFYNGTALLFSDSQSPYEYTLTNVNGGAYTLTAMAIDNLGAVTTSAVVNVSVKSPVEDNCSSIATYMEGGPYVAGSIVKNAGKKYECRSYPNSGWCSGAASGYSPGVGTHWQDAWTFVDSCTAIPASVVEITKELSASIIPNPSRAAFTCSFKSPVASVHVMDVLGQVVYANSNVAMELAFGEELQSGTYLAIVLYADGQVQRDVIVKMQ